MFLLVLSWLTGTTPMTLGLFRLSSLSRWLSSNSAWIRLANAGWDVYFAGHGVRGYGCTTLVGRRLLVPAARMLIAEKRDREARDAGACGWVERQAIEADQRFRASLGVGLPASALPHGMTSTAEAIASHELDRQQYRPRASMVETYFRNSGSIHLPIPIQHDGDES